LGKATNSVAQCRYDAAELVRAAQLLDGSTEYSGGLRDAILAITRVLIDNGAYSG
jgi:hypothetical protein